MDIRSLLLLPSFNADNDAPPGALCTVGVTLLAAGIGTAIDVTYVTILGFIFHRPKPVE
jgi:hypothetical protein